jgi:hypothetical protein
MNRDLEIMCVYRSNQGREITYNAILSKEDVMDSGDYEAEYFWQTMGGFMITKDGYKTILYSTEFYNIVKPINFLLHSLYKIKNVKSDWFDDKKVMSGEIEIFTVSNDILKLKILDRNNISLSYLPLHDNERNRRGKHYFHEEKINTDSWIRETEIALSEYFNILSDLTKARSENSTVNIMKEYLRLFNSICNTNSEERLPP